MLFWGNLVFELAQFETSTLNKAIYENLTMFEYLQNSLRLRLGFEPILSWIRKPIETDGQISTLNMQIPLSNPSF